MADKDFETFDFSGTVSMYAGDAPLPIELTGLHKVPLIRLPFDIRLDAEEGQGCAIVLETTAEGDEVTLLSTTGSLNLRLTYGGISFLVPQTGERALIRGEFHIGEDLTVRPLMAAPELPTMCKHGISPISKCPLNPP